MVGVRGGYWGKCPSIKYTQGHGVLDQIENNLEFALKDASQSTINELWLPAPFTGETAVECSCIKEGKSADMFCNSCYGVKYLGGYRKYGYSYLEIGSTMSTKVSYNTSIIELTSEFRPYRLRLMSGQLTGYIATTAQAFDFGVGGAEYKLDAYRKGDSNVITLEYRKDSGAWLPITSLTAETGYVASVQFRILLSRASTERSPEFEFLRVRALNSSITEPYIYISRTRNPEDLEKTKYGQQMTESGIRYWTLLDFELPSRSFVKNISTGNPYYGQLYELFEFQRSFFGVRNFRQIFNARLIPPLKEAYSKVF